MPRNGIGTWASLDPTWAQTLVRPRFGLLVGWWRDAVQSQLGETIEIGMADFFDRDPHPVLEPLSSKAPMAHVQLLNFRAWTHKRHGCVRFRG
jgi:hypothetical protein